LKPLNPYGKSKNEFDRWVLQQDRPPFFWAGLKFFNVYGPNEYHKGRMASVVYHAYRQIEDTGGMKLFRSHHPNFKDGEQSRDFIYVNDVVDVILYLMEKRPASGLFNLGTGKGSTVMEVIHAFEKSTGIKLNYKMVDRRPGDIEIIYADTSLANNELGWKAEKNLEEMMKSAWNWQITL
jgi:ADP-L-glycero-D-manno-heptose 6-epimerase